MKLTRQDIIALAVLTLGLLAQSFGHTEGARFSGALASGIGLLGCILSFLV